MLARLYRSSAKDLMSGSANIRRYSRAFAASAAASIISFTDTEICPVDTVRLIVAAWVSLVPGAAQNAISIDLGIVDQQGNRVSAVWNGMPSFQGGAVNHRMGGPCEAILFQGDALAFAADFSAGAASNTVNIGVVGWEFPRGTLQR